MTAADAADEGNSASSDAREENDVEGLRTQLAVLAEENDRLRDAYAAARRTQYRRTAIALATIGVLAAGAAVIFPAARTVLLALAGIGVFAGILTYYLTPERFVAASVGERVQRSAADTYASLIEELGLQHTQLYIPRDDADPVLFIPLHRGYEIPDPDALEERFVITEADATRGITLIPAGAALFAEFEPALSGPLRSAPGPLAEQLSDGLVEQFELARSVDTDVEPGRITYAIDDPALGSLSDIDHPIVSFLAVGTATGVDAPVTVDIDDTADPPLVTCRWPTE